MSGKPILTGPNDFTLGVWFSVSKLPNERATLLAIGDSQAGISLDLNSAGRASCELRDPTGEQTASIVIDDAIRLDRWHLLVATAQSGGSLQATLVRPRAGYEPESVSVARGQALDESPHLSSASIAALQDEAGGSLYHFDGRLDSPFVVVGPNRLHEVRTSADFDSELMSCGTSVLDHWDMGCSFETPVVIDRGSNLAHLALMNAPMRAVRGCRWTSQSTSHLERPEHYGAIHFRSDDIEDAEWEDSFSFEIPDAPSGIYGVQIEDLDGTVLDTVPLAVCPPRGEAQADILLVLPTMTYLAYANERIADALPPEDIKGGAAEFDANDRLLVEHPEFGRSIYDAHADGSGISKSSRLRPVLNFRANYNTWLTDGPRHFRADMLIRDWLDSGSFSFDVVTDEELHFEGESLLRRYKVVLTGNHPEYYTARMLDGIEAYLQSGGRLMYLGGNGFYWVTGLFPGRPHLLEVRRGYAGTRTWESHPAETHMASTGERGGLWKFRGRPPHALVGVGFTAEGWGSATGYTRAVDPADDWAFVFEGVSKARFGEYGLTMGGAAGDELDRADEAQGTPWNAAVLASSGPHTKYYQHVVEEVLVNLSAAPQGGDEHPDVHADLVGMWIPGGGAVFSTGSMAWAGSLPIDDFTNDVARISSNVLKRFMSD